MPTKPRFFGWFSAKTERRGQCTREYVEVMRKLWTERSSSHQDEFVKFTNVLSYPKPVSENGVPVWFGGESNPALRRVAEYGDGWIGFNLLPDEAVEKIKRINHDHVGRPESEIIVLQRAAGSVNS